jgi:hypothetical protein
LEFPSGLAAMIPPEPCAVPATLLGFLLPYSDIDVEIH